MTHRSAPVSVSGSRTKPNPTIQASKPSSTVRAVDLPNDQAAAARAEAAVERTLRSKLRPEQLQLIDTVDQLIAVEKTQKKR